MQAVLLGAVVETNWFEQGVTAASFMESWPLEGGEGVEDGGAALASDGQFLYLHGQFGLRKIGSGYSNTRKVGGRMGNRPVINSETKCLSVYLPVFSLVLGANLCSQL